MYYFIRPIWFYTRWVPEAPHKDLHSMVCLSTYAFYLTCQALQLMAAPRDSSEMVCVSHKWLSLLGPPLPCRRCLSLMILPSVTPVSFFPLFPWQQFLQGMYSSTCFVKYTGRRHIAWPSEIRSLRSLVPGCYRGFLSILPQKK
jgi:hypothetical protein